MLEAKYIRDHLDEVRERLALRGQAINLDQFVLIDGERRKTIQEWERLRALQKKVSDEVSKRKREGQDASDLIEEMKKVSQDLKRLDGVVEEKEKILQDFLLTVPNLPHASVPAGKDSSDNVEVRQWGEIPKFDFKPKAHWDLGEELGILDFKNGAKITGARFTLYWDLGAKLERALINFMLDLHTREHGYREVLPPFMVNRTSMTGTGQLPKFEEELFKVEGTDYFLIPTAEVPVTNIHQDEVLEERVLPLYYTAYTPCFRKEAGSYGKDTRGLIRQHQFNKVELVKFAKPETSYDELEKLLTNAEEVLKRLKLPYRVVNLCSGDLGFSASKTYDIEVWLPGQQTFKEISSCSNFEDFQARRAKIRYRISGKSKTEYVHTLNGSGLAVGRTLVAILENYQQADGSVTIPEVLRHYLYGAEKIEKGK
ncbi:MAG TPA: serine--tRNA ligase [Thermodesulfobacteriota bacterium]|nr:serine--tRNA ligase [Thermodesulfobacteriota bacterium]